MLNIWRKSRRPYFWPKYSRPVYDEAGGSGGTGDGGTGDGGTGGTGDGGTGGGAKTFTQEEVNALIAKSRNEDKEKNKKLLTQLDTLKSSATMTKQERDKLEAQIEELKTQSMTKEELTQRERKKLEEKLTSERDGLKAESDAWRGRFESSTVINALMDAAVVGEAFSPQQIVDMLKPSTKVVEDKDADGNLTGAFKVVTSFNDSDKDGKPITLALSPNDLIKRMKDIPERFGNLFKSGTVSGLGTSNGRKVNGVVDYTSMTPAQYREQRKQLKKDGKL